MSRRKKRQQPPKATFPIKWVVISTLTLLVLLSTAAWWWLNTTDPPEAALSTAVYTGVTGCRRQPQFPQQLNLSPNALIGTNLAGYVGFTISEPPTETEPGLVYQDESWDDAGNLGAYTLDRAGNFYLVPVPLTSLELNPPEKQNILYRIDGQTGLMEPILDLPAAAPPPDNNPYGLVSLTYDCDNHSLYVSSLAGSTPTEELGRIYHIDLETQTILHQFENVDALGIGIFNGVSGKRLYYGSARQPQVLSIPLDEAGDFVGQPRPEFTLSTIPNIGNQRARRFDFNQPNEMVMRTTEFNYSLRIASQPRANIVALTYEPAEDSWLVQEVAPLTLPSP